MRLTPAAFIFQKYYTGEFPQGGGVAGGGVGGGVNRKGDGPGVNRGRNTLKMTKYMCTLCNPNGFILNARFSEIYGNVVDFSFAQFVF